MGPDSNTYDGRKGDRKGHFPRSEQTAYPFSPESQAQRRIDVLAEAKHVEPEDPKPPREATNLLSDANFGGDVAEPSPTVTLS
jgi:hypothetical protein